MQIDMHYGAIYYLASLAGINPDEAEKIAWSSQFVDDAQFGGTVQFGGGEGCVCNNSAHQYVTDNLSAYARLVWIPYHFVPDTTTQGSFLERLKCKKDSNLARDVVNDALKEPDIALRPYRFGVALHAYADTWSHHDFSGFWSDSNLVDHVKPTNVKQNLWEVIKTKAGNLYSKIKGKGESSLGHLFADVCPDIPYLQWKYSVTAGGPEIPRDNPGDYRKAIESIYGYMVQYQPSASSPDIPEKHREIFNKLIEQHVDNPQKRLSQWSDAISREFQRNLPEYKEKKWIDDALGREWKKDRCIVSYTSYSIFVKSNYWLFCEALRKHINLIVESLNKQGLNIV